MRINSRSELDKAMKKMVAEGGGAFAALKGQSSGSLMVVGQSDLLELAEALAEYLRNRIQDYFDSYEPSWYVRTGRFMRSVKVRTDTENGRLAAVVYFDDDGAIRDSFMDNQPQGYLPALLNDGWLVRKPVSFLDVFHMGYYLHQEDDGVGFGFIEQAVADAMKEQRFGNIRITIRKNSPF